MREAAGVRSGAGSGLHKSWLACPLMLLIVAVSIGLVAVGSVLLHRARVDHALERRTALQTALGVMNSAETGPVRFDRAALSKLERIVAVHDLRFEPEPVVDGRELHSIVDGQGRIVGWLSWQGSPILDHTSLGVWMLLTLAGLGCAGLAATASWQSRRSARALEASERRGWALANEDSLTGLPNYRHLSEVIDEALAHRSKDGAVTLALVDLDGFDEVNQKHGHHGGDELLRAWAKRMCREVGRAAVCSRFNGDRFAILMVHPDAGNALPTLRRLSVALGRPYGVSGRWVEVDCTMGFAQAPHQAVSRTELIRCAELALRAGKTSRRGDVVAFDLAMDDEVAERRFIERELKRALATGGLDVHYQPILSSDGGRIVGAEALLRWNHRERGVIAPTTFVPVAEQTGLMQSLGAFVLRRALSDALRWPDIFISVNLSPVQVRDPALVDLVETCLNETGVPSRRLILEVTEGVLIDKPDEAKERLDALRNLGVGLALDDFGTGYSSLTYLQRFRFDKLKIDKSFVEPLGTSSDSQAIVQGIVRIGQALGLSTLAEGVETEEQRVLLRLVGCEEMQGFLFARPAPAEAIDRLLASEDSMASFRRAG